MDVGVGEMGKEDGAGSQGEDSEGSGQGGELGLPEETDHQPPAHCARPEPSLGRCWSRASQHGIGTSEHGPGTARGHGTHW